MPKNNPNFYVHCETNVVSRTPYRHIATTEAGFVQQLAVSYIVHGYWFYVCGHIPERKDPLATDRKLLDRYEIEISKWARARRKRAGSANVHYLRYGPFFVLIATKGEHKFFNDESGIKDVRRDSIRIGQYSLGYKRGSDGKWHPSVRIHPDRYREVKSFFLKMSTKRGEDDIVRELQSLRFVMFAPVRAQVLSILREVNRMRGAAGLARVSQSRLDLRRRSLTVFG